MKATTLALSLAFAAGFFALGFTSQAYAGEGCGGYATHTADTIKDDNSIADGSTAETPGTNQGG